MEVASTSTSTLKQKLRVELLEKAVAVFVLLPYSLSELTWCSDVVRGDSQETRWSLLTVRSNLLDLGLLVVVYLTLSMRLYRKMNDLRILVAGAMKSSSL